MNDGNAISPVALAPINYYPSHCFHFTSLHLHVINLLYPYKSLHSTPAGNESWGANNAVGRAPPAKENATKQHYLALVSNSGRHY